MKKIILLLGFMILMSSFVSADVSTITGEPIECNNNYILCDDFNDGVINSTFWNSGCSASETNGRLSTSGNCVTDNWGSGGVYMPFNASYDFCIEWEMEGSDGNLFTLDSDNNHDDSDMGACISLGTGGGTAKVELNLTGNGNQCSNAATPPLHLYTFANNVNYTFQLCYDNTTTGLWNWSQYDTSGTLLNTTTQNRNLADFNSVSTNGINMWGYNGVAKINYIIAWIGTPDDAPQAQGTAPVISGIDCTSCNIPFGDNTSPYTTSDTTPTFSFDTDIGANCRIGGENQNYTTMESSRDCTLEQGTTQHICTLTVQDELYASTSYVYVSCANNGNGNESANASMSLQMNITDLAENSSLAIDRGIQNSVIWPGATVYSDQQVYLRDLSDNQVLATVDRVAVYGNQRWIINAAIDNETPLNLFNISPVVYVLDMINTSLTDIEQLVADLINDTKN